MPDNVIGFSPNWYEGQNNAGLAIYVAPGSINGVVYPGQLVTVPKAGVTCIYIGCDKTIQQGNTFPAGIYPIAIVVSGTILTGTGINVYSVQQTIAPGIISITDMRPILNPDFAFDCSGGGGDFGMISNNEIVSMSGTTGNVAHVPNGQFFLLTKNGVVQNMGIGGDFTLFGTTITLAVAAISGDLYIAWYTY